MPCPVSTYERLTACDFLRVLPGFVEASCEPLLLFGTSDLRRCVRGCAMVRRIEGRAVEWGGRERWRQFTRLSADREPDSSKPSAPISAAGGSDQSPPGCTDSADHSERVPASSRNAACVGSLGTTSRSSMFPGGRHRGVHEIHQDVLVKLVRRRIDLQDRRPIPEMSRRTREPLGPGLQDSVVADVDHVSTWPYYAQVASSISFTDFTPLSVSLGGVWPRPSSYRSNHGRPASV